MHSSAHDPASQSAYTILPHELPEALDRAAPGTSILSLDCFDTLLWRDCHAPADVFSALGQQVALGQRVEAESRARKAMRTLKQRSEVSLGDIYAQALPNSNEAQCDTAIAAELAAEARVCFAFGPTVELMRAAKARGLTIIIVSDTYLGAAQLLELIRESAGEEVADLIDAVFASSEAGISKSEGLLGRAMKAMKCSAGEILHIGDNFKADYEGARALGIPALHLAQFGDDTRQRLRLERAMAQVNSGAMAAARDGAPGSPQPHRASLALVEPQIEDAAEALGFTALGPVFAAYDRWLRAEAEALAARHGGQVHWLFMLRDGHLPCRVHEVGGNAASTARVEISRFVSIAASLRDPAAYQQHMALEHGLNPPTLARQMLMEPDEIERLIGQPETDSERADASSRLLAELRTGRRRKLTARRARAMAEGLVRHVKSACDPKPGDVLMLVDLGYNGSAQNAIDALLREELGVHVAGRYLLCRERQFTGLDKTGMIDARNFDAGVLEAMCGNVAVIEQLATCELGSVAGYDEKGVPLRTGSQMKGRQSAVRARVQEGTVRFARTIAANPAIRTADPDQQAHWREAAAAALQRFMFLPLESELEVVRDFEHDVNLGSDRMVALFDSAEAETRMKRRGLFYMKGSSRMFLPAELASQDMSTRLSLLAHKRFGLGLTYTDCAPQTLDLQVLHVSGEAGSASHVAARATHDGFFCARIPLGRSGAGIAVQLGEMLEWVEIAQAVCVPVSSLMDGEHEERARKPVIQFEGMREHAPGLFECESERALMLIASPSLPDEPHMLEIALRPIRQRSRKAVDAQSPAASILSSTNARSEHAA